MFEMRVTTFDNNKEFQAYFGKLWSVIGLTGFYTMDASVEHPKGARLSIIKLRKTIFPILLCINLVYLWYLEVCNSLFNYATILDVILTSTPLLLWIHIFKFQKLFKDLLTHACKIFQTNVIPQPRTFTLFINFSLVLVFIMPLGLATIRKYCKPVNNSFYSVTLRYYQEITFTSITSITYCAMCIFFIQSLRSYKTKFIELRDFGCFQCNEESVKNYTNLLKTVEEFQDFFSTPVFLIVVQNFCNVSLIILDFMSARDWGSVLMWEAMPYLVFSCALIGTVSVTASEIPLEIRRIRSVFLDILSLAETNNGLMNGKRQIKIVMERDLPVFNACNAFPIDRGFIVKFLAAITAQALVFYQVIQYKIHA